MLFLINANTQKVLTGPDAPKPPSQDANQSSNCHPTLPKSNDLTYVFGYNDTGSAYFNSTRSMLDSVNLVLTTFWSVNGSTEGGLETPETHATCLWPVDMDKRAHDQSSPN